MYVCFCLQIKGENVRIKARELKDPYEAQDVLLNKCRFPLYFILTASNAILSGGYLLSHYISVSINLGELAMQQVITAKSQDRRLTHHAVKYGPS